MILYRVLSCLLALSAGKCVRLSSFLFLPPLHLPKVLTLCRWCSSDFFFLLKKEKQKNTTASRWQITFVEERDVKFPLLSQKLLGI